jgi:DNA invertase Pin-like site-specific DNA recombinase
MRIAFVKQKGHWPKGRRKNDPRVSAGELRRVLRRFLRYKIQKGLSYRALEEELGKSDRTLRRWIAGEDWPDARDFRAIRRLTMGAML